MSFANIKENELIQKDRDRTINNTRFASDLQTKNWNIRYCACFESETILWNNFVVFKKIWILDFYDDKLLNNCLVIISFTFFHLLLVLAPLIQTVGARNNQKLRKTSDPKVNILIPNV